MNSKSPRLSELKYIMSRLSAINLHVIMESDPEHIRNFVKKGHELLSLDFRMRIDHIKKLGIKKKDILNERLGNQGSDLQSD